jgi:hypothetical protein
MCNQFMTIFQISKSGKRKSKISRATHTVITWDLQTSCRLYQSITSHYLNKKIYSRWVAMSSIVSTGLVWGTTLLSIFGSTREAWEEAVLPLDRQHQVKSNNKTCQTHQQPAAVMHTNVHRSNKLSLWSVSVSLRASLQLTCTGCFIPTVSLW